MIIALVQVYKQKAQENRQEEKLMILLEGGRFLEVGVGGVTPYPPVRVE